MSCGVGEQYLPLIGKREERKMSLRTFGLRTAVRIELTLWVVSEVSSVPLQERQKVVCHNHRKKSPPPESLCGKNKADYSTCTRPLSNNDCCTTCIIISSDAAITAVVPESCCSKALRSESRGRGGTRHHLSACVRIPRAASSIRHDETSHHDRGSRDGDLATDPHRDPHV